MLRAVLRPTGSDVTFLPQGGILPREATSYADNYTGNDLACYSLATLRGQELLSLSDFSCFLPGTRSGQAPRNLTYWLSEGGRANFTWVAPGTQTDYVLFSVLDQRINVLSGNATSALDVTGGRPACHLLVVRRNEAVIGNSPLTCLIPVR